MSLVLVSRRWHLGNFKYGLLRKTKRSFQHSLASTGSSSSSGNDVSEPRIPMVPKRRDPNAVLKALAATIEEVESPSRIDRRSIADPLSPRNRAAHMEFVAVREAGKQAAQYVIKRWPQMFSDGKTAPQKSISKDPSEEALKFLISKRKTERASEMYKRLKENGIAVSLETQNELLALCAYYGVGNPLSEELDSDTMFIDWPQTKDSTATDKSTSEPSSAVTVESGKMKTKFRVWSSNNFPEQLFSEMSERNSATYDALIGGLVKFKSYNRAFKMFTEMRQNGYQGSVHTYNALLSAFVDPDLNIPRVWSKAKFLVKEMTDPTCSCPPNITTMNLVLQCSLKTGNLMIQHALMTVREILALGLEPNLETFTFLLRVFFDQGDGRILKEILSYLENNPQVIKLTSQNDFQFFQWANTMARQCRDLSLATRLTELAMKDNLFLVNNSNLFMSNYLITLAYGSSSELKNEYAKYVPRFVVPYEWAYGVLLRAAEIANDPEFGLRLWRDMRMYSVPIHNKETLERVCGAFTSSNIKIEDVPRYVFALGNVWQKAEAEKIKPPAILISQMVRFQLMNQNLEEAWRYYSHFKENNIAPTYTALMSLLRTYSNLGDKDKCLQILETMISCSMTLSRKFVTDMCFNLGIDHQTRDNLLERFEKNSKEDSFNRTLTTVNVRKKKVYRPHIQDVPTLTS